MCDDEKESFFTQAFDEPRHLYSPRALLACGGRQIRKLQQKLFACTNLPERMDTASASLRPVLMLPAPACPGLRRSSWICRPPDISNDTLTAKPMGSRFFFTENGESACFNPLYVISSIHIGLCTLSCAPCCERARSQILTWMSSSVSCMRGGTPSTMHPTPAQWLSPNVETLNSVPKEDIFACVLANGEVGPLYAANLSLYDSDQSCYY